MTAGWRAKGFDLDMASLTFTADRCEVVDYLTAKGWRVDSLPRSDLFARYSVEMPADNSDFTGEPAYVTAGLAVG